MCLGAWNRANILQVDDMLPILGDQKGKRKRVRGKDGEEVAEEGAEGSLASEKS